MKNYALDTSLLPEVWVTWLNKNGRVWMNNKGERQTHPEPWMRYDGEYDIHYRRGYGDIRLPFGSTWATRENNKLWVNAGSSLYYAYAKYHEDIDRLEIAAVRYDTKRGEENHTWYYDGGRYFIGKDKSIVDINGKSDRVYTVKTQRHGFAYNDKDLLSMILRLTHNKKFVNEFKKFLGHNYYVIGNGTTVDVKHGYHLQKWFMSKQKTRSTGKSQKLVDELVKMPLGEIAHLTYKYLPKRNLDSYRGYEYCKNIIYFERVNDEWSVLRALIRTDDGYFDEVWRVYLGDDGTNRIATKSNDDWVPSSQNKDWYFRRSYYFANEKEAIEKCDRIKYIAPMMEEEDGVDRLITTLRFPCVEQLYKMGQKNIALSIARSSQPKAYLKEIFGYYNEKEKNVLRQIGMTKSQLDSYCSKRDTSNRYYSCNVMKKMRETLGNDLSRIDNATFNRYLDAFDVILCSMWTARYVDNLDVDKSKFWKNVVRLNEKNNNAARLIGDTLSDYNRLYGETVEVDWLFDDYSDIVRTHNALITLREEREAERRAYYNMAEADRRRKEDEKRKKVDEERKHYEYEDEEFIIRLPKDVYEIITEGSKQCICIGGYTSRHSSGDTNLFFLRRKDDEDTPFYAIEMNKNKTIVQIHGHSNKWLGNNPEAIPTVVRWLRKNGIKCDNKILTCTAKGYSSRNEYVEMPIVD